MSKTGFAGFALAVVAAMTAPAFADLQIEFGEGEDVPNSWALPINATVTEGSVAPSQFDSIKLYAGGAVSFTTSGGTFTTAAQYFEDITGSGGHRAVQNWSNYETTTPAFNGDGGWSQTSPSAGSGSAITYVTAASSSAVTAGGYNHLDFKVYFNQEMSDGVHFFLEFFNGTSFAGGYDVKYIRRPGDPGPNSEYSPYSTPIPLPPAVWSGLAVLGGMGFMIARRRRSQILA